MWTTCARLGAPQTNLAYLKRGMEPTGGLDPYKLFRVERNAYTLDQIKQKYRRLAMKLHPDKNPDPRAAQLFNTISMCYQQLLEEYAARMSDRQSHELKAESLQFAQSQARAATATTTTAAAASSASTTGTRTSRSRRSTNATPIGKNDFDLTKFNKLFADNREEDPQLDSGYGDWMKNTPAEDRIAQEQHRKLQLQLHRQPQAAAAVQTYELGGNAVVDYSTPVVAASGKKELQMYDYKIAHTTTKLMDDVNPQSYRQDFRSVDHLQTARASMPMHATAADMAAMAEQRRCEEAAEQMRIDRLKRQDQHSVERFSRLHQLMLGRAPASFQ